nr:MAG TPA: hypothetical protein [Caudoviricetes sp.]
MTILPNSYNLFMLSISDIKPRRHFAIGVLLIWN